MTNKKRPKVTIVTGKVKMVKMGFTIKFNRLSTMATRIAVVYEAILTPGSSFAKITTAKALNKMRKINFIKKGYSH